MKTSEKEWLAYLKDKELMKIPRMHTIILSPHPDDESLGAGGLIFDLRKNNVDVLIISITDGENAYPDAKNLGQIRRKEQESALRILGVTKEKIIRLHLKDSAVKEAEKQLEQLILPFIDQNVHLIAPWTGDYHADHEAVGRVALKLARQKKIHLSFYFFWTWQHSSILDMKNLTLFIYPLSRNAFHTKQKAIDCYTSQKSNKKNHPILPESVLIPTMRSFEVYGQYDY
ncbi:glucosamine-6-phosphate deaminase-like protein [Legionella wadsworthii]|uniref:Glucosamine-6-phosphate deaminase-like protein n=1 Tax=Legionella wadsworthii TaxID=28088 RepID=A0A378LRP9_9GAMM|nr:PIG-L family deacetylase [Legionella wadsworthii]STY29645.1 glucosamine-6-phosphate deaminase-like protein [Legionella wadsworthii]